GRPADDAHFALRKRHDHAAAAQSLEYRSGELACRSNIVRDLNPRPHRNAHRRVPQQGRLHDRRRILQHARIGLQHLPDRRERTVDLRVVGDTYHDVELTQCAVVMQNLPDDLAVGNDYARAVGMPQCRAEERDGVHLSLFRNDRDVLADAERLGEDDGQPGDHVAQHALRRQREAGAHHAQACNQGQQLHSQVLEREDDEQQERQRPAYSGEQYPYRRLKLDPAQRPREPPGRPTGGDTSGDQDQDGDQKFGTEPDRQIQDRTFDVLYGGGLLV